MRNSLTSKRDDFTNKPDVLLLLLLLVVVVVVVAVVVVVMVTGLSGVQLGL